MYEGAICLMPVQKEKPQGQCYYSKITHQLIIVTVSRCGHSKVLKLNRVEIEIKGILYLANN